MDHFTQQWIGTFRATCISAGSLEVLNSTLAATGFDRYQIDSRSITCKRTLLAALTQGFNLEHREPLDSWDAAADLIWQKLMDQSGNRAALICHNAHQLLAGHLQVLLDALELLLGVAETVERQTPGDGCHPVFLRIFLVGDGPNFPPLSR